MASELYVPRHRLALVDRQEIHGRNDVLKFDNGKRKTCFN